MGSIKKKLNKVVNKVADKVMPKELAPFLPIISMFAPGLGIGSLLGKFGMTGLNPTMMRWVMPQITNALASGKMGGEVDWKGAAMAAAASALHGPQSQTEAEKQFLKDNKVLLDKSSDAALRQAKLDTAELVTDPSAYYEELQNMQNSLLNPEQMRMQDNTFMDTIKDWFMPDDMTMFGERFGQDVEGSWMAREPKHFYKFDDGNVFAVDQNNLWGIGENARLNEYLENMPTPDTYKPFLDQPDVTGQAFKDFFTDKEILGDTALSEKMFDKKMKNALDIAGKQPMKVAMNKAKDFFQTPPGFNSATMAKIGMGATPWISAEAKKDKEEAEQAEADWQNKIDAMTDAEQALTDYYWNMNPDYDWLYKNKNYYNTGGRVNKSIGGVIKALIKPTGKAIKAIKTKLKKMSDDVELKGTSDFADDTGSSFLIQAVPKTKKGLRELNKLADEGTIQRERGGGFTFGSGRANDNMEALEELFPYKGSNLKASGFFDDLNQFKTVDDLKAMRPEVPYGYDDMLEYLARGKKADGGRVNRMGGGIMGAMPPEGTQWDGRQGGFMPLGQKPQADDVPAMLSKDEFVMTRDAVKGLGDGDANVGAQRMYDLMNSLEAKTYV